ncbi:MAG: hypothetical protein QOK08_971 [Actinomycetota bacterium]|nr:hypothetical protein [Actinomycetota bacterium]
MSAGESARLEAERQLALASAHEREATASRSKAGRFMAAAESEKRIARLLAPLTAHGHFLLPDRQWPGSRRAQVDLVVVGPGGVFIVDTKWWKDVMVAGGRVYRDQDDVTDEFDGLADLAYGTEAALAAVGLAPGEVRSVVVLAGRSGIEESVGTVDVVGEGDIVRYIVRHGKRMSDAQVDTVLGAALQHFPVVGAPAPVAAVVREPVLDATPAEVDVDALMTEQEVKAVIYEGLLAEPIEEWMAFLHPDQAKLVRRSFNGPARIRGAAGTGKTVVGLHRAAYLARAKPEGKILFTTFVRTLPDVMRNTLKRMAPDVAERVEFRGVYELAGSVLSDRGISSKLDSKRVKTAWWDAWRAASAPLKTIDSKPDYWKEEIDYVIKGRGLTRFDQYADSARIGRKRRLTIDQRREVWALYREYEQQLEKQGIHDFADRILATERTLREQPLAGYSAVIVDEAQDLSCAMVRMLWSLVGDEPDAFTLIGDGQQTIYPGGYTLAEAGISLSGRGVVLDINYRNTAEILQAAARIVDGDEFTDIEGADQLGDGTQRVSRHGSSPEFARFETDAVHDEALVAHIRAVTREIGTGVGDVAVLCRTKAQAASATRALAAAGLPTVQLTDYDGEPIDAVKIGTIKRAKGLEFKQVLLPRVDASLLTPSAVRDPDGSESLLERHERDRRELYVGMTRARDGVWVGSIGGSAE